MGLSNVKMGEGNSNDIQISKNCSLDKIVI